MSDDGFSSNEQTTVPRTLSVSGAVSDVVLPAVDTAPDTMCPRSGAVDDGFDVDGGGARSALPGHGDEQRPVAAGHGPGDRPLQMPPTNPFFKPNDGARPVATEAAPNGGGSAAGRSHLVSETENVVNDGGARTPSVLGAAGHDELAAPDYEPAVSEPASETSEPAAKADPGDSDVSNKDTARAAPPAAPPASADLVTVEEAVAIFSQRGLPRHMRTIQKYCSREKGRALVCYQVPTENGIRYMIERASIDRFIGDAAQQAPTGKIENETIATPPEREAAPAPVANVGDIFEHPFVQRLEAQVERLESRNETLQREIQNVLMDANERLVELQKANAVAQSESLGTFLLEAERIRRRQDAAASDLGNEQTGTSPLMAKPSVNREGRQFGTFDV